MYTIQVIRLLDVLRVNAIRNAPGVVPRSIIVTGADFRSVESVLMNGLLAPEFVVYSATELVAEVPEDLREAAIADVAVLSSALTLTDRSLVEFTFGTRPKKLRGILRLMQVFLLFAQIGSPITEHVAADAAVAVTNARQYIIGVQTPEQNIPPSERLLSAEISGLIVDPGSTSMYLTVLLTSHSGARGAATLTA